MRRRTAVAALALGLAGLAGAPGVASADVIFDPADAEELAVTLADAYQVQDVCYGWSIDVYNEGIWETSVGSNFGAGQSLQDAGGDCPASVEFQANITWTPESSESEDSASYSVVSVPSGPTTEDLDDLEIISTDGLEGDDVDSDVYKAVAALPLLAADAGLADPIEASPAPEADSADAAPTDPPSPDFWRQSGMLIIWGALLMLAGAVFAGYVIISRRRAPRPLGPAEEQIPAAPPKRTAPPNRARPVEPRSRAPERPTERLTGKPTGTAEGPAAEQPAGEPAPQPKPDSQPKPDE